MSRLVLKKIAPDKENNANRKLRISRIKNIKNGKYVDTFNRPGVGKLFLYRANKIVSIFRLCRPNSLCCYLPILHYSTREATDNI